MRNELTGELAVCGFNAVKALGDYHPEKVNRLFLREERLHALGALCKSLAGRKRPYKICENEELERVSGSAHHQGAVAIIDTPVVPPATPDDLEEWAREGKVCVFPCEVGNDHNLGAIVRAAAVFDAAAVILAGETALTTSAYRVAEGGMEHTAFRRVRSPEAFLRAASRLLVTVGADARARIRIRDLPAIIRERGTRLQPRPGAAAGVMLVLGNEETGLSREARDACSVLARIPGTGLVESLNVSQAAALFLEALYER